MNQFDPVGRGIHETQPEPFSVTRLILGLLLLIPGVFVYLVIQWGPTLNTIYLSQTRYNAISEPEFIGMENFDRLLSDTAYGQAVGYTVVIIFVRLLIVAIVPPLVGTLVGAQSFSGRTTNRVLLSALAMLISPVALAVMFAGFVSPVWGTTPSPLTISANILGSPDSARTSVLLIDAIVTLGIAAAVGGAAFMAVMRGRGVSLSGTRAGIGVWLLGLILTAASASQTFSIPYVLTGGGPANSTLTIGLHLFNQTFRNLNLGYGSAQAVLMIVPALILGLLAGLLVWLFRLRLRFTPPAPPAEAAGVFGFLSTPLILLLGLPSLVLFLWGIWLLTSTGAYARLEEMINVGQVLSHTISAPWIAIWVIQIPLAYMLGLALGFVRPVNWIVSNLIFIGMMALAFIPVEALSISWYENLRELGALNSPTGIQYAFLINAFSLLVFKMFFDGAYERYRAAQREGQTATDAFLNTTLLPSLGIVLVVGAVLSFASAQSLLWPLIVINTPELRGFPTTLVMLRGSFSVDYPLIVGAAVVFVGVLGLIFVPVFALLNVLVVDRLSLLAGPTVEDEPARSQTPVQPPSSVTGF